jgi:hypothetical protein
LEDFVARTPVKGEYTPVNGQKYIGKHPIIYRSSWELTMMRKFDEHPNVVAWASETVQVPYQNPLTGKWSLYVPDFLVVYADKTGKKHAEIIQVKPLKERPDYQRKQGERLSERTKLAQIVNAAKWAACVKFCAKNQLSFRVASEDEMFAYRRKK